MNDQQIENGPVLPLTARALEALTLVVDPVMLENIVDLGLVYNIEASPAGEVTIWMTTPAPQYPGAEALAARAREVLLAQPGVVTVDVRLVWDAQRPWTPYLMADHLKAALGLPAEEPPAPAEPPPPSRLRLMWSRLAQRNDA